MPHPRCLISVSAGLILLLGASVLPAADTKPRPEASELFEKSVRPVLADNCFNCHGPDKQKGGLRLDSRAALLSGGDSGPVVVPGKPAESLLLKALSHQTESLKMPPKGKLKAEERAAISRWVELGAPWPDAGMQPMRTAALAGKGYQVTAKDREFWSFRPIGDPPTPPVRDTGWTKTPVDAFVLAKLEENHFVPAAPADKQTLLRRATFDLTGLPPTPDEIDAFLQDRSSGAFARVVERLLQSPHYGERWARYWLDVARYGEDQAHTFQARKYPQGFRYRDWLIHAFNEDMPYDRFILEQIAADLLEGPNQLERLPALGYFALGPVYYGDPKKLDQIDDRIDTLSRGFLGLTVACARCHDHKYDPIPTRDYYALAGVFASTEYVETPLVSEEQVKAAQQALTEAEKKQKVPPKYPFTHALKDAAKPVTLRVHVRGNPENLGVEAPHQFLSVLSAEGVMPFSQGSGRLELARAIASPANPLTARVLVNRVWKQHFGRGLVRTASNFGALGELPTHPELLDHLATRFIRSGWSIKQLHREIMLSAAYQMNSQFDAHNAELDGDNRLLWHRNRRRLEVEAWRDAMLAVAGTLDHAIGGPSADLNVADYRRRTLYGSVSRHDLNPLLRLFDFPDPNITSDGRTETTVPLQQLFVLNSEFMVRNAKALVARLKTVAPDDGGRIHQAFRLLYGRPATDDEIRRGQEFLAAKDAGAEKLDRWERYAQVLLSANEFLYVD